jgi:uncharacterized protein YndB with AHSA1/START domain
LNAVIKNKFDRFKSQQPILEEIIMTKTEKAVRAEVIVNADQEDVWVAWTTEEGVKTFLAPACNIDLRPGGAYEIYFNPGAPAGERGGEGNRVMSAQPMEMFSFSWNAPPTLPEVRDQRTHVVLRFYQENGGTRVTLYHDGWGTGGQWEQAFEYFQRAWGEVVLPRLQYRFEHGAVDWDNPTNPGQLAVGSEGPSA